MKKIIILLFLLFPLQCFATNWYFSPTGNDSSNTGIISSPWLNPGSHNSSYSPGDVLNISSGTYTPTYGWTFTSSGNSSNYIKIQCSSNNGSLIQVNTANQSGILFTQGASYWIVNGCTINSIGLNGSGISVSGQFSYPYGALTHYIFENNIIYGASCNGIGIAGNTNNGLPLDYFTIKNNLVYGNAFTSSYHCSGISVYEPVNFDDSSGYHIFIQGNISYGNHDCDSGCGTPTDGNGIILDDFLHLQTDNIPYRANTLVQNNITFNNGGRGIHAFESQNILIENNTVWGDLQDNLLCGINGEISAVNSFKIQIYNNIIQPTTSTICTSYSVYGIYEYGNFMKTNDIFDWNYADGVGGNNYFSQNSINFSFGNHNVFGVNPNLNSPSALSLGTLYSIIITDFSPSNSSPVLQQSYSIFTPQFDINGNNRNLWHNGGKNGDLGAIQISP